MTTETLTQALIPLDFARLTRASLVVTGGRFMTASQMDTAGSQFGLPGKVLYFRGRVGALGDVNAAVATAVLGIFPPVVVESVWQQTATLPAAAAATAYASACQQWGREHLSGISQPESIAELAERIVDAADTGALALTAAWRAWPRPDDPAARAAHAITLLRELRGGLHFCALRAEGLDIPMAVLADPGGGPDRLSRTAWSPDAIDELRRGAGTMPDLAGRWQRAEAATDTAFARCVRVITAVERAHLAHQLHIAERSSATS
jgi:Helix-turn-helix family